MSQGWWIVSILDLTCLWLLKIYVKFRSPELTFRINSSAPSKTITFVSIFMWMYFIRILKFDNSFKQNVSVRQQHKISVCGYVAEKYASHSQIHMYIDLSKKR